MTTSLLETIKDHMKTAMKEKQSLRLTTIRMLLSEIKNKEIDSKELLDEQGIQSIVIKMIKQRKDAEQKFTEANRLDLAGKEKQEVEVLQAYLPTPLSSEEIEHIICTAITDSKATSLKEMGKVMALIKPTLKGRADMSEASQRVKQKLQS